MRRTLFRLLLVAIALFGVGLAVDGVREWREEIPVVQAGLRSGAATRPIEQIRVGDRVWAENPQVPADRRARWVEPDWSNWSWLSLELPLGEPVGANEPLPLLRIELLRPDPWWRERLRWIVRDDPQQETEPPTGVRGTDMPCPPLAPLALETAVASGCLEAAAGEVLALTVDLDLPEMGAAGTAVVTDIRQAPPVRPGPGSVVTGTFSHPPTAALLDVWFEGLQRPLGVTDNHLFYIADREEFLPIGEVELGERVRTADGQSRRLIRKTARPASTEVHNLEVYGEHVYFVGDAGLLVHNSYTGDLGESATKGWLRRHGYTEVMQLQNRSGHGIDVIARHRDGTLTFFEVKTSITARAPRLTRAQRDARSFIRSRLARAASGGRWWSSTPTHVRATALELYREVRRGTKVRRYRVEITNATSPDADTIFRIRPW